MNWTEINLDYDEDTQLLYQISAELLEMYFDQPKGKGDKIITEFLMLYSDRFDEDFIHHDGAYRVSAIAWYLICQNGNIDNFGEWLINFDRKNSSGEANTYIINRYQGHWKPGGGIY